MFIHYRTQGLILQKKEQGEADQIFTIYTKDFGKIEVLARGIRKITSKLRAGVDIFYLSNIEFIQGKNYKTLTDAIAIKKFANIKKSLLRLKIAYKISDVFDYLIQGQEADEKIWHFLVGTFEKLNNPSLPPKRLPLLYYYFSWNLFSLLGYGPELYFCRICQRKIKPQRFYFNPREGGIVCQYCFKKSKIAIPLRPEIIKILREILKQNWKILSRLKVEKIYLQSLEKISRNYLAQILEKNEEIF